MKEPTVYYFLFAGYSAIWALIFAYTLALVNRQKKLQADIDLLKSAMEKKRAGR